VRCCFLIVLSIDEYTIICVYSFIAQCYLKLKHFERTIKNCHEVLQLNVNNVKALYRMSIAYRSMQEFDLARSHLNTAIQIEPYNADIIDEAQRLDRAIEQQKKSEQKLYYRMFHHQ
jgi:tetratricopeptide (TPR) repeat protein